MILEFFQPTNPWFRAVYDLYSFAVMPLAGKILVGSWGAYAYLTESIHLFPYPGELSGILAGQGVLSCHVPSSQQWHCSGTPGAPNLKKPMNC